MIGKQMTTTIAEQPQVWMRILENRDILCENGLRLWGNRRRALIVGSGSSYNAALCAQRFYEDVLGIETTLPPALA